MEKLIFLKTRFSLTTLSVSDWNWPSSTNFHLYQKLSGFVWMFLDITVYILRLQNLSYTTTSVGPYNISASLSLCGDFIYQHVDWRYNTYSADVESG